MKNIFKGYYKLGDEELQSLWKNALFIFDTNVLLNLYRYQSTTSNELFTVMESFSDRVWIPYHVGLEFQKRRLNVIEKQHKKFSEVEKIVRNSIGKIKKGLGDSQPENYHSHIKPDEFSDFLKSLEEIQNDLCEKLDKLENQSININSEDKIRNRIDALFRGKIGNGPKDQKEIDEIFCEGEKRYKNEIPPGYEDSSKDDELPDTFTYAGIIYQRQYGDLIIWKQIISYASEKSVKDLIFVTDDQKADWRWKIDNKRIGVRPELRDEISREASVENFHIFNLHGFLRYFNEQSDVKVTEEAIKEVREVSDDRRERIMRTQAIRQLAFSAEKAVYEWLSHNLPHFDLEQNRRGQPDFIGYHDGRKYGFEVRLVQTLPVVMYRLREMIYRFYYMLNEEGFYEIAMIFVVLDEEIIPELRSLIRRGRWKEQRNLRIIIGKAEYSEEDGQVYYFTPYDDFTLGDPPG